MSQISERIDFGCEELGLHRGAGTTLPCKRCKQGGEGGGGGEWGDGRQVDVKASGSGSDFWKDGRNQRGAASVLVTAAENPIQRRKRKMTVPWRKRGGEGGKHDRKIQKWCVWGSQQEREMAGTNKSLGHLCPFRASIRGAALGNSSGQVWWASWPTDSHCFPLFVLNWLNRDQRNQTDLKQSFVSLLCLRLSLFKPWWTRLA